MRSSIIDLYAAENLPANRCYDGVLLLWPVNDTAEIQKSEQAETVNDAVRLINHNEVFQVSKNTKMLMIYIASDWFTEKDFAFFNYCFNIQMVQSSRKIKKAMLVLLEKYLEETLTEKMIKQYISEICDILIEEASVEIKHASHKLGASLDYRDKKIVDYINEHIGEKLTLERVAKEVFISPTTLSSSFYKIFNMGFRNYIETLRIGYSIEMLITTDRKILDISEEVGFSNFSGYYRKFKRHLDTTPNDYRHKSKLSKDLCYLVQDQDSEVSDEDKKVYLSKVKDILNNWTEDKENIIYVDDNNLVYAPAHPFVMTIQIHTVDELKKVMVYRRHQEIFDFDEEVMFLIHPSIPQIHQQFNSSELIAMLDTIHQQNIRVAFELESKDDIDYVKNELLKTRTFIEHPAYRDLKKDSSKISITFSLQNQTLKDINIQKMRLKELGFNVKFNLDVTKLFNDPEKFKALELPMKRVNFDYYFIDNEKLKYPYLEKSYSTMSMKQLVNLNALQAVMRQAHLEERKYILINVPNRKLLNDDMSLLDSTPLMMYMFIRFYSVLSGIGVDLYQHSDKNTAYLFDKNGFKTTLYFLYRQLSGFKTFYFYEDDACLMTRCDEHYSIIVYDWRIIENEMHEDNQSNHRFYIGFKDKSSRDNYLITREVTDYKYGNINEIISPHIMSAFKWPKDFMRKIKNANNPKFDVFEHNFENSTLSVDVEYNSLQLISLYKTTN
ncbi:helix-turn-helix domain-containing protein [Staphylococcus simulans]|uniref:helix-turn-helix domain-containing protein n=1 Tax=Staphylococcus simulans TaxID=1286 RepID=UPI00399B1E2D